MEKSSITTSMIIALILGLVVGFFAGAWWGKARSSNANLTAIDSTVDATASSTDVSLAPGDAASVNNPLTAAVSTAVSTSPAGQVVSVASTKVAMPDATLGTINNQAAGARVTVSNITVAKDSWVAVRDSLDGAIGNILGAVMVSAGTHENVNVPLMRATVKGSNYFLVVYEDDGDHVFDYKKDRMLEQNSQVRVVPFSAL